MKKINCPNCNAEVTLDISNCVDALGEIHRCPSCGYNFRFTDK